MKRSERRQWIPISHAIKFIAIRKATTDTEAWEALKVDIGRGELPVQCIDDLGTRIPFEPHWIGQTAKFLSRNQKPRPLFNDPGDNLPVHESRNEIYPLTDFPCDGHLWFDRKRAAEARLARAITADNRRDPSLPPRFIRDIVVDAARFSELYSDTNCDNMKALFSAWAEAEKAKYGSYPLQQAGDKGRYSIRKWASDNSVSRDTVQQWADELGISRRRGRPKQKRDK